MVRGQIVEVKIVTGGVLCRSAALPLANSKIDQASQKDERGGPDSDRERASGLHPEFGMRGEQAPGQGVGGQSAGNAERDAENEIAFEGHGPRSRLSQVDVVPKFGIAVRLT